MKTIAADLEMELKDAGIDVISVSVSGGVRKIQLKDESQRAQADQINAAFIEKIDAPELTLESLSKRIRALEIKYLEQGK